ncbi:MULTISPECIES: YbjQ family protein [unclassified Shewanella]|uniref:YbjQ family protein n=1 Tax=unclassified Shewanella TaxID=196818 RepID=UPI001A9996B8|nr:YbjQ family protein [Shewanella sp. 4t3-1-2LB]MBO1273549.1 YbjQ family protein [Shewanella sp. 4t3-1-2LB]
MKVSTTENIAGYRVIQTLGVVTGNVVRSKHIGRDIMAGLKTIIGGEIVGYTEMLAEAREVATQRMLAQAEQLGADAVVNVRYTTSAIAQGMSEMLAYGTAVKLGIEA